uniref:Uncharacterized protein n=1 Tax=Quercus lobata TaxID=97700 RepID=A0A7N2MGL6_QUELO
MHQLILTLAFDALQFWPSQIPKGVQPGQLLVLRGLPKRGFLVDHGDQYVRFHVNFPTIIWTYAEEAFVECSFTKSMKLMIEINEC